MTSKHAWLRSRLLAGIAFTAFMAIGANSAGAITTQDNFTPDDLLDTGNVYKNVGGLLVLDPDTQPGFTGICTGTLINPRTVLTATHCVRNSGGSEVFTAGGPYTVRFRLGPDGLAVASNFATDVIMPAGANEALFPDLDFTILALGTPVGDIDYAPVLLSPLTQETVATMVGFGTFGTGSEPEQGLDFKRRVAKNVIQYLGTFEDFDDDTFGPDDYGDSTQMLYFVDLDRVGREEFFDDALGIDYDPLPGDALYDPNDAKNTEGGTGGGDSGGPLFAHVKGKQYLAGVLSGGLTIFGDENGNGLFGYYGTESYWNPIFDYADFLIANNPYKYVHARSGSGDWTDPTHWEQTLDPGYFILDRRGNPKNGVPGVPYDPEAVKFGQFRNIYDILDGGDGFPDAATTDGSAYLPAAGLTGGTAVAATSGGGGGSSRPASLQGPGSRNFVPNNTNGTPGTEFLNPAQYFDVTLDNNGTTRLRNATITIDKLTISDSKAALDIRSNGGLTVNLETEVALGGLNVDGRLTTRRLINTIGVIEGAGVINATNGVTNLAGLVSPGGKDIGTLTINGAFTQSDFGTLYFQIGRNTADLLEVNGAADVNGNLLVGASRLLRFGERFTVIHADSVTGNFDRTFGSGTLLFGRTVADADSVDLVIDAFKLFDLFRGTQWGSLATALDYARGNSFASMSGVFDMVDNMPLESLDRFLPSLTPMSAMEQMPLAIAYSQTFTRDLATRTAELRAGAVGISPRSLLNGYRMLGGDPEAEGASGFMPGASKPVDMRDRFGMFITGQGNLADVGKEAYEGDRYDPNALTFASQASMTVGMDYRVSNNFVLGFATTMTRYQTHTADRTPMDHSGYGAMLYSTMWQGDAFLDSYFGVAYQDFEVNRSVFDGAQMALSNSNPRATQAIAGARGGYMFHPTDAFAIGPTVRVNYSQLDFDAYRESGGGAFDLMIDSRSMSSLTVETAMEFAYQPLMADRELQFAAYGRIGLVSEVGDGMDSVTARFAAAPEMAFDLSQKLDRQWIAAGVGMSFQIGDSTTATLEGNADLGRGDLSAVTVSAGLSYRF